MKVVAKSEHEAFRLDLLELVKKHSEELAADEILAIASFMLGQLIALQAQDAMPAARAMNIVAINLQMGNQSAMEKLHKPEGRS